MQPEVTVLEELVDIVPGAPLRKTDRKRFLRSLGIQTCLGSGASIGQNAASESSDSAWIARVVGNAAFEMPLPPRWSEQVDPRGYIYFAHALRSEGTWEHPLLPVFRETMDFASAIVNADENLAEAAGAVKAHLRLVQDRAARELQDWTGPHREPGSSDEYFFNDMTGESTWESPLEVWQYELHARYWLCVRVLQHMHIRHEGASAISHDTCDALRSAEHRKVDGREMNHSIGALSLLESTLSTSGLSAAVRSHASDIASSLASSAPSFGKDGKFSICPAPSHVTDRADVKPTPPKQRMPPKRPPPPLRHLAAPPRATDVPPEQQLRATSPTLCIGRPKASVDGPPPPPPSSSVGSTARVMPKLPPPPPPKKLGTAFRIDENDIESPKASPKSLASGKLPTFGVSKQESHGEPSASPQGSAKNLLGYSNSVDECQAVPNADTAGYPEHVLASATRVNNGSLPIDLSNDELVSDVRDPASRCFPGVVSHPTGGEAPPEERKEDGRRPSTLNSHGSSWAGRHVISSSHSDDGLAGRAVKKRSTLASMVCVVT